MSIMENDLVWEDTACDYCGSSPAEGDILFEGPDRAEHLPGIFRVVRCQRCGILRQTPRLAWVSLKDYYTENYDSHSILVRQERGFLRRLDKRYGPWKRLKAVERHSPGGRLLDVGCGTGLFLEEALRSGHWQVTGVEPSERAASYTRENLRIPIYQNLFSEVNFPLDTFDVVTMWSVLEHLDRPFSNLRYTQKILKTSGWLVFAIPNMEGWEARLFGKYWMGWELPRHLYYFPRAQLRAIVEEIGFRWVDQRCISTSYSVLGDTLNYWSQSWETRHPMLRRLMLGFYRSWLARLLLLPFLWVMDRLKLSTIITIFVQKR